MIIKYNDEIVSKSLTEECVVLCCVAAQLLKHRITAEWPKMI